MNTGYVVLFSLSRVLLAFAPTYLVPLGWSYGLGEADHHSWLWVACFVAPLISGGALWAYTRRHRRELQAKDGFLVVNLVWLVLPAYAAVPLMFTVPDITWIKAYFEAMSALTATGSTALSGLDALPVSVNGWRCFLQLIGGWASCCWWWRCCRCWAWGVCSSTRPRRPAR